MEEAFKLFYRQIVLIQFLWNLQALSDQIVKTPVPSLFFSSHSMPSTPSTSYLQGLISISPHGAVCPQDLFFRAKQLRRAASCKLHLQHAWRTSPHCSDIPASIPDEFAPAAAMQSLLANFPIWGTPRKLALSCYPCKGKEQTFFLLCRLSSVFAQQELHSIQHWNPNFLLHPAAPFLQRSVTLNWVRQHG